MRLTQGPMGSWLTEIPHAYCRIQSYIVCFHGTCPENLSFYHGLINARFVIVGTSAQFTASGKLQRTNL